MASAVGDGSGDASAGGAGDGLGDGPGSMRVVVGCGTVMVVDGVPGGAIEGHGNGASPPPVGHGLRLYCVGSAERVLPGVRVPCRTDASGVPAPGPDAIGVPDAGGPTASSSPQAQSEPSRSAGTTISASELRQVIPSGLLARDADMVFITARERRVTSPRTA
ncbi:hypothetical protein ACIBQ1_02095 [Nonomuraea sp. NPDC050153]|uniref:hypothetical protein n=1 Tax=Nonomuraea sp. NPDC050153 TaxID=3364359 RepID=UPI00378E876C